MSEFNIDVNVGSSVRLPTAGKYCDRDIIVTATGGAECDHPAEFYTGEITGSVSGSEAYVTLATDPILAEHRNDESLMAIVEFDIDTTAYSIVSCVGVNVPDHWGFLSGTGVYQWTKRWDGSGARGVGQVNVSINTNAPAGVGCIQITESGELRVYSNSSNYAIRPCKYRAELRW